MYTCIRFNDTTRLVKCSSIPAVTCVFEIYLPGNSRKYPVAAADAPEYSDSWRTDGVRIASDVRRFVRSPCLGIYSFIFLFGDKNVDCKTVNDRGRNSILQRVFILRATISREFDNRKRWSPFRSVTHATRRSRRIFVPITYRLRNLITDSNSPRSLLLQTDFPTCLIFHSRVTENGIKRNTSNLKIQRKLIFSRHLRRFQIGFQVSYHSMTLTRLKLNRRVAVCDGRKRKITLITNLFFLFCLFLLSARCSPNRTNRCKTPMRFL